MRRLLLVALVVAFAGLPILVVYNTVGLVLPTIPGVLNPDVTPATISTTICVKGWTATVRPPVSYTSALKRQLLADGNLPGTVSDYQLDHLVSLEVGGAPKDPRNLWMEPVSEAHRDDRFENRYHQLVCDGTWGLNYARRVEVRYKTSHG